MKSYQLFQAISKDLQQEILTHLQTQHLQAFRMVVGQLAVQRKLRPVFMEKKPVTEQKTFAAQQLCIRANDEVSAQVIQLWLLKSQQPMLKAFLDAVGIEHKDGEVEKLPEDINEADAKKGIEALLSEYSGERVALYLHMFQTQRPGGFTGITSVMAADDRLKLGA